MALKTVLLVFGLAWWATAIAIAQPTSDAPAAGEPARPVLIPITPGTSSSTPVPDKPVKPGRPRARTITAPGGLSGDSGAPIKRDTDYQFCNRTSYEIQVALGMRLNTGFWATRGWWPVPAGECRAVIKGKLTQASFYTFAKSSFAHTGPIRMWGGNQTLCTGKTQFEASSDGSEQCGPGLEAQGFAKVDTGGKPAWVTFLTETPGYKSNEQARIAGLQRLLADLGRYSGDIDGNATPKFSEALAAARTEFKIPVTDDAGTLYAKLHAEAMKAQAAVGLTFCNRTQDIVWAALAREMQGKKISQGWWKLQAGQCEKVIRDRVDEGAVFAFAERSGESTDEPWHGSFDFCTRRQVFEIEGAEDCAGRGFEKKGFLKIDTRGQPSAIFEIQAPHKDEPAPQGQ